LCQGSGSGERTPPALQKLQYVIPHQR